MLSGIQCGLIRLPRGIAGRSLLGRNTLRHLGTPPGGSDSLKTRFSPAAGNGDIYIISAGNNLNYAVHLRQDGTHWWNAFGNESEQTIQADLFALTTGLAGEGTLAINVQAPRPNTPSGSFFGNATLQIGQAIDIQLQAIDPGGFAITWAISAGTFPPGLSLNTATGEVTGTPTTYGAFGFTIRVSNQFTVFTDSIEQVTVATILPDFTGNQLSTAQAAITALGLTSTNSSISSNQPLNAVLSQSPGAGAIITSSSVVVALVVSNGALSVSVPNLFPNTLTGITFDSTRTMEWSTSYQETDIGKVSTLARMQYPIVHWDLSYEILNQALAVDELKAIAGLYTAKQGQAGTFLYLDPIFNTVTGEPFGTGNGSASQFQLIAAYGNTGGPSVAEIVQHLQTPPTLFDNGTPVLTSAYSIGPTGIVSFNSAPASGHALTWSGSFYYLAQFEEDDLSPQQYMNQFWSLNSLKIKQVIQ